MRRPKWTTAKVETLGLFDDLDTLHSIHQSTRSAACAYAGIYDLGEPETTQAFNAIVDHMNQQHWNVRAVAVKVAMADPPETTCNEWLRSAKHSNVPFGVKMRGDNRRWR